LWEKGFFGKGSLSRSDPSWLNREKRRRGVAAQQSSEEYTQSRREERRQMKFERALKERETIESQLRQEGKLLDLTEANGEVTSPHEKSFINDEYIPNGLTQQRDQKPPAEIIDFPEARINPDKPIEASPNAQADASHAIIEEQEHLQLSLEEAFFLSFSLGVLEVYDESSTTPLSTYSLFEKLRTASYSPHTRPPAARPDDPFLLKYVVYHHFRSLGWVLRGGSKFSVDYLLYNRGPVFSHAEYAVLVLPSYSDQYWIDPSRNADVKRSESRDWHWLHCINRVQAHVHKTLVLVYVDIPPPLESGPQESEEMSIGKLLQRYKVREFVVRRWLFNRSRD
jgi:tRNA-splicing endonuclease subunit Sen2